MDRLIHPALKGLPVAWFSPTYKLLADTWRELRTALAPVTRDKSEQEKRLELVSGGAIELWSLDSPDAARGRKYAVVVIDEAAMIVSLEEAWQQSFRPTLTDISGEAWFLSTPKGMNYFKELYDLGQDSGRGEWMSWQMPTSANPYIDPSEIESARLDLSEAAFNQEYLAWFVNWEGSVFRRVGESATASRLTQPEPGHESVVGCDWGRSHDYTVFAVLDTTARVMVAMDRSNRVDYTLQRGRLQVAGLVRNLASQTDPRRTEQYWPSGDRTAYAGRFAHSAVHHNQCQQSIGRGGIGVGFRTWRDSHS